MKQKIILKYQFNSQWKPTLKGTIGFHEHNPHQVLKDDCVFELCYSYLTPSEHAKDKVFQLTFTCSKLTIETQEKGMKYVQSQQ